jgi:uncharacterized protein YjbI with pentapeptide repeats
MLIHPIRNKNSSICASSVFVVKVLGCNVDFQNVNNQNVDNQNVDIQIVDFQNVNFQIGNFQSVDILTASIYITGPAWQTTAGVRW